METEEALLLLEEINDMLMEGYELLDVRPEHLTALEHAVMSLEDE